MNKGFQMERDYNEGLHLETLRLIRYTAYTTYIGIPTKKGFKKSRITKFYSLPNDPKNKGVSLIERDDISNRRAVLITNGKKRGYQESGGNALYSEPIGGVVIAYINDGVIEKVN